MTMKSLFLCVKIDFLWAEFRIENTQSGMSIDLEMNPRKECGSAEFRLFFFQIYLIPIANRIFIYLFSST